MVLAKQRFNLRERDLQSLHATFVPFTAQTRMSGINMNQRVIRRKGRWTPFAATWRPTAASSLPMSIGQVEEVGWQGPRRCVVAEGGEVYWGLLRSEVLGEGGVGERLRPELRKMGVENA